MQFEWKDVNLLYEQKEDEIIITGVRGTPFKIEIPGEIDNLPVTVIAKKAFLSIRGLYSVELPDTIREIGEWAFAYTKTLEEVSFPGKEIEFGKDLFLGCEKLAKIVFRDYENRKYGTDMSYLIAKAMTDFNAPFLCNPLEAGTLDWYRMYDDRLLDYIKKDDLDGYAELWTCGEEDYEGKDYDAYSYPNERRKKKVKSCFFRLIHEDGLQESVKEFLISYLKAHSVGNEQEETWEVMEEELGSSYDHYRLFVETGCLTDDNFDEIMNRLQRLSEKDVTKQYPEMKAYFIRAREPKQEVVGDKFFDTFSLDDF